MLNISKLYNHIETTCKWQLKKTAKRMRPVSPASTPDSRFVLFPQYFCFSLKLCFPGKLSRIWRNRLLFIRHSRGSRAQHHFHSLVLFSPSPPPPRPPEFWSCRITIHGNESRDKQLQSSLLQSIFPCIVSASECIPLHLLRAQSVVLKSTSAEWSTAESPQGQK